jgi:hypothetical protein
MVRGSGSYCVYLLANLVNNRTYVGCTHNLPQRLRRHNGELVGGARQTRLYRPWFVVCCMTSDLSGVLGNPPIAPTADVDVSDDNLFHSYSSSQSSVDSVDSSSDRSATLVINQHSFSQSLALSLEAIWKKIKYVPATYGISRTSGKSLSRVSPETEDQKKAPKVRLGNGINRRIQVATYMLLERESHRLPPGTSLVFDPLSTTDPRMTGVIHSAHSVHLQLVGQIRNSPTA